MKTLSTFPNMSVAAPASSSSSNSLSSPSTPASDISDISSPTFSSSNSGNPSSLRISTTNYNAFFNKNNINDLTINTNIRNSNINNNSAPTTPVAIAVSTGLPHITSMPQFTRFNTDYNDTPSPSVYLSPSSEKDFLVVPTHNPFRLQKASSSSSSSSSSSGSLNEAEGYITFQPKDFSTSTSCLSTCFSSSSSSGPSANQRKTEFDKCLIKQNQIPAFEIPPRRTPASKNDKIEPDMIVPSLYRASHLDSPSGRKKIKRFRGSASSPNISRFFTSEHDQPSNYSSSSSSSLSSNIKGVAAKIRQAVHRDSRQETDWEMSAASSVSDDYSLESPCSFDVQRGHSLLQKVKQDYEDLSNWNVLSRYKKMKKMLKSCSAIDIE